MSSVRVQQVLQVRDDPANSRAGHRREIFVRSKWYDVAALAQDRSLATELVLASWASEVQTDLDDDTAAYIVEQENGFFIIPKREIMSVQLVREDIQ